MHKLTISIIFLSICCLLNAAPLPKIMVDLTHVLNEHAQRYPIFKPFNLTVILNGTFLDTGIWAQGEEYTSTTHAGTHMDAPSHFIPGGLNIDQLRIEDFMAPAAVIDISERARLDPDTGITVEDLLAWEYNTGHTLNGTIVLQRAGWDKHYLNSTAYLGNSDNDLTTFHFPGFEHEAAQWLVENRDIKGVGTDTMSFDKGTSQEFMAHKHILGKGLFGMENVANVDKIPIFGAKLYVFPSKMVHASGAPVRIVAVYPKVIF